MKAFSHNSLLYCPQGGTLMQPRGKQTAAHQTGKWAMAGTVVVHDVDAFQCFPVCWKSYNQHTGFVSVSRIATHDS